MTPPHEKPSSLAFWVDTLSGDVPAATFAPDFARLPRTGSDYATIELEVAPAVMQNVKQLERGVECSTFSILATTVVTLLSKYVRGNEVVLGSPSRLAPRASERNPVALPLRFVFQRSETFSSLLARVDDGARQAFEHQEIDFAELLAATRLEESRDRCPLFDVALELEGFTNPLDLDAYPVDVALCFQSTEAALRCRLRYRGSLYRRDTIQRLCAHFVNALSALVSGRDPAIKDIQILTTDEIEQVVTSLNGNEASFPVDRTFHGLFEDHVVAVPRQTAVVFQQESLTYAELNRRANRLARALVAAGLEKGDFVCILQHRNCNFLAAMLAVFKAGGAYVPVDPTYPSDRIRYMITDSRARFVITEAEPFSEVAGYLQEAPDLRVVISQKGQIESRVLGARSSASFLGPEELAVLPQDNLNLSLNGEDRAYMIYTSGSTGLPKGAICRHDGALNHLFGELSGLGIRGSFSFLQTAASSSDISVWQFMAPLVRGGITHIVDHDTVVDPEALFEIIQRHRIDLVELVPVVLRALVDHIVGLPESARALPALRSMMATGDALPVDVVNSWFALYPSIPVANTYGPTEASDDVTLYVIREPLPSTRAIVPIGRPMPNLSIFILDPTLGLTPFGVPGEICVSGIGVGEGYWNQPTKTAAVFIKNPIPGARGDVVYRTGDLGRWLPDGTIEFLGRLDQQVKIRGFRIEPGEVETALLRNETVSEAVVLARPDRGGNKVLVAYVVPEPGEPVSTTELRSFLAASLPDYMVPSAFVILESMPLTPIGKIDRKALADSDSVPRETSNTYVEPRTATERVLAEIWSSVLDLPNVSVVDNFVELGGDSILGITLAARAKDAGLAIRPKHILQHPTVRELARVADTLAKSSSAVSPVTGARTESQRSDGDPFPLAHVDSKQIRSIRERYPDLEDLYPLTSTQLGLYLQSVLSPRGTGVYIEQIAFNVSGELSMDAFEAAWQCVIEETPVLRTGFTRRGLRTPLQVVVREVPFQLHRLDLRDVSEKQAAFEATTLEERSRGFDISRPPLMRTIVARLDETTHRVLWTYHHIVLDGWSEPLILGRVFRAYARLSGGKDCLPEPAAPYRAFVAWLEQQDWEEAETYWRERLSGLVEPNPISRTSGEHAEPGITHGWIEHSLSPEKTRALESTARRWRLTLSTLLQGAWALLLCEMTHSRDVVFGTATSGREADLAGIESIPGLFIETLPLRVLVDDRMKVGAWLDVIQGHTVEMRQYEHIGYHRLQAVSDVPTEKLPLFDSIFVMANYPGSELNEETGANLKVSAVEYTTMPHYPLTLFVVTGQDLELRLVFARSSFSEDFISRVLDRYTRLLNHICSDSERKLGELISTPHAQA